jgi:hypothetical protein
MDNGNEIMDYEYAASIHLQKIQSDDETVMHYEDL